MAGQVTFTVNADVAKAISGILSITGAQGKVVEGFKHVKEHGNFATETIAKFGEELVAIGASYLSLEGVKHVFEGISEAIAKAREEMVKLQENLKGPGTLPGNIGNPAQFEAKVINLSQQYGADATKIVTPLLQQVGEEGSNLPMATQDAIAVNALRMRKAMKSDAGQVAEAELRMGQAYGDTPQQAINRLLFLREKGGLSPESSAQLLPDVMPAAVDAGFSEDEMDAIIAGATKIGGSNERVKSGIRRLFTGTRDAKERGDLTLSGNIGDKLKQLGALRTSDPELFQKIAGKRSEDIVSGITGRADMIQGYLGDLQGMGGDKLKEIEEEREKYPKGQIAERAEADKQVNDLLPSQASLAQQQFAERNALRKTGARIMTQNLIGNWATGWGLDATLAGISAFGSKPEKDPFILEALKAQTGNPEIVDANTVKHLWKQVDALSDNPRIRTKAVGDEVLPRTARALAADRRGDTVTETVELLAAIKALKEAAEKLDDAGESQKAGANARSRTATME